MINKKLALFSLVIFPLIPLAAQAQSDKHVVVAPQCLVNKLGTDYKTLSSVNTLTLIETTNTGIDKLIEAKNQHHATPCGGFMDVTEAWNAYSTQNIAAKNAKSFLAQYANSNKPTAAKKGPTYDVKYQTQVNQLISDMNPQDMWTDLTTLSNYPDRYAGSDTGVKAAAWLKTQIETMAKNAGRDDVSTYYVATGTAYKQPSLVVKIGNATGPGIVIGGHMDTLSSSWELKPGADDDGSGSVTVLEVARNIINSGMHFKKPIYIIWYSAEEEGLIGSGFVVKDFKKKNIPVDAVLQFDMTGYANKNDPTIWLITDNIDNDLTKYLETLVKTYVKQPVDYTRCGYACSDHASWNQAGFKASFPFEASFGNDDPYIHTADDKMNVLSLSHMTDYAKLGTAFAVELAEPVV